MKILNIVLAAVAVIGLVAYVGYLAPTESKATEKLAIAEDDLAIAKKKQEKAKEERDQQKETLEEAQSELATIESNIQQTTSEVEILDKKVKEKIADKESEIAALDDQLKSNQESIELTEQEFLDKYGSYDIVGIDDSIDTGKSKLSSLNEELDALTVQKEEATTAYDYALESSSGVKKYFTDRAKAVKFNEFKSTVVGHNKEWSLLVLNSGSSDGLEKGTPLMLTANNAPVVLCEVIDVTSKRAIAEIKQFYIEAESIMGYDGNEAVLASTGN